MNSKSLVVVALQLWCSYARLSGLNAFDMLESVRGWKESLGSIRALEKHCGTGVSLCFAVGVITGNGSIFDECLQGSLLGLHLLIQKQTGSTSRPVNTWSLLGHALRLSLHQR